MNILKSLSAKVKLATPKDLVIIEVASLTLSQEKEFRDVLKKYAKAKKIKVPIVVVFGTKRVNIVTPYRGE